jgi:poly(A) polymerase
VRLLDSLGLLDALLPELARARGVGQPENYHHYDVFDHCIEALAVTDWLLSEDEPRGELPRALRRAFRAAFRSFGLDAYFKGVSGGQTRATLTKFATLLHDVSKPETKTEDADGRLRFLGHSELGARVAGEICSRLRFGTRERAFVARLVEEHLRPAQLSQTGLPTDRAIFRFFRALGDAAPACLVLSLADAAAAIGPRLTLERWQRHLAYIAYVFERARGQSELVGGAAAGQAGALDWARRGRHFVSGDTLIRVLGLKPGPEVGRLLLAIDEAAGSGDVQTEDQAIQLARELQAADSASRTGAA